ncbi:MAG: hypothetical protein JXR07_11705 [Reichenbachiella sp.]
MKFKKKIIMCVVFISSTLIACAQFNEKKILEELNLNPRGKTEVVKKFPKDFPQTLILRGDPLVYNSENSNNFEYIGMPVGGIGAGQLYLGGDGQLWFWDIFIQNSRYLDMKGEEAYMEPYERSKPNEDGAVMIEQGFSVSVKSSGIEITKRLNRDGFEDIEFLGQYPIGEVNYRSEEIPVDIKLEAFSPFAPLDIENSIYPATILNYSVKNTSAEAIEVRLMGWLENAVLASSKADEKLVKNMQLKNKIQPLNRGLRLATIAIPSSPAQWETLKDISDFGSMSLAVIGDKQELFSSEESTQDIVLPESLIGNVGSKFKLAPKESKEVSFLLTWHFKNAVIGIDTLWTEDDRIEYFDLKRDHYYATKFRNAMDVSDHIINRIDELTTRTRKWRDTWYDSSLPYWFLDRTFLNTDILASSTSKLLEGFMFYGWEGSNQGMGTCNHVWGYAQAMGRLFPSLEESLREYMDFLAEEDGGALLPDGGIRHRWMSSQVMAVDGQASTIMRTYLIHQMQKDGDFLSKYYPMIKKVMQGLTNQNDADCDGILTGSQHNTLDAAWYGKVTWLSLHYTAALRATAEMAEEMGDDEYAAFCRSTADKGKAYIENNLFNGEYFIHEADPEHPDSPGTYQGLEYSQLFGQSWAYQVGLGEIIDRVKAKTALESMWRYNFTTDVGPFREVHKPGRWYAMPGEGGLIACTWPKGGQEVLAKGNERFAAYNNESQNGYEYAATSLMMWHDMPYHSLTHIWQMHNDRYHGSKRNPWAEVEWGIHYARSMASYGHFVAVAGFEYHGPKGYMAFDPKITPNDFKSAFTAAEGWGSIEQRRTKKSQNNEIEVIWGNLKLSKLALNVGDNFSVRLLKTRIKDKEVAAQFSQIGSRVEIIFDNEVSIATGEVLTVNLNK